MMSLSIYQLLFIFPHNNNPMKQPFPVLFILFTFLCRPATAQTEVTFYTNYGNFVVKMYDSITPITSGNFVSLVKQNFYDGLTFHRVIKNFMIQGGDPNGNGTGGP